MDSSADTWRSRVDLLNCWSLSYIWWCRRNKAGLDYYVFIQISFWGCRSSLKETPPPPTLITYSRFSGDKWDDPPPPMHLLHQQLLPRCLWVKPISQIPCVFTDLFLCPCSASESRHSESASWCPPPCPEQWSPYASSRTATGLLCGCECWPQSTWPFSGTPLRFRVILMLHTIGSSCSPSRLGCCWLWSG